MTKDDRRLAEIRDPEGRAVVLLARLWDEKITRDHPELRAHLQQVTAPDHVEPTHERVGGATTVAALVRAAGCWWS